MKPFDLYKHQNNTDVAMMPIKIYRVPEKDYYKVECRWFNIVNPANVFDLGMGIETVTIKAVDMPKWEPYVSHSDQNGENV